MAPKPAKNNTAKTETISVRLDPKMKFGLELLSRKQYRNLSSVVEWALNRVVTDDIEGISYLDHIWDVYEADRLIKLALHHPELLSYEEQAVWKLIKENGGCWFGHYQGKIWTWQVREESAIWEKIRTYWETFKKVAKGEADASQLPKWNKYKSEETKVDFDDEIPF